MSLRRSTPATALLCGTVLCAVGASLAAPTAGAAAAPAPAPATPSASASPTKFANLAYGPDSPANLLDLYVPAGAGPGSGRPALPVLIWTSGSAFSSNTVKDGAMAGQIVAEFTARGYAVAAMNVHTNREAHFPTQGYDARAAVRYLREHARAYGLDPQRIVTMGNSSGAWSTAYAAANSDVTQLPGETGVDGVSSKVNASVLFFSPTQFLTMDTFATENGLPMPAPFYPHDAPTSPESILIRCPGESDANEMGIQDCPQTTTAADPSTYLQGKEVPLWVLHGMADDKVPYNQSQNLYATTTSQGNAAKFTLVPDGQHDPNTLIGAAQATTWTTDRAGRETTTTGAAPTWDDIDAFLRASLPGQQGG